MKRVERNIAESMIIVHEIHTFDPNLWFCNQIRSDRTIDFAKTDTGENWVKPQFKLELPIILIQLGFYIPSGTPILVSNLFA